MCFFFAANLKSSCETTGWTLETLTDARGQERRYGGAFRPTSEILCVWFCHHLHTAPFLLAPALASGNLLMTRKAELGQSKPLHSSTCSRTRSLWCSGRSGDQRKTRRQTRQGSSDTQSLGRTTTSEGVGLNLTKLENRSCTPPRIPPHHLHNNPPPSSTPPPSFHHGAVTNYLQQIRKCLQKHTHVQNRPIISA